MKIHAITTALVLILTAAVAARPSPLTPDLVHEAARPEIEPFLRFLTPYGLSGAAWLHRWRK
jgi:hypothetical protein